MSELRHLPTVVCRPRFVIGAAVLALAITLVRPWPKALITVVAVVALISAISTQRALDQRRHQIEQIFDTPTPAPS